MVIDLNNLNHEDAKNSGDMFFNGYHSLLKLYTNLEILNFYPREAIDATDAFLYASDKEPNIRCNPLIKVDDASGMLSSFELPINIDIDFRKLLNAFDIKEASNIGGMLADTNIKGNISIHDIDFGRLESASELFKGTSCNKISIKNVSFNNAKIDGLFWGTRASKITLDKVDFSKARFLRYAENKRFTNIGTLDIHKNCKWPINLNSRFLNSSFLESLFGTNVIINVVRINKEDRWIVDEIGNFQRTEQFTGYLNSLSVSIQINRIDLI